MAKRKKQDDDPRERVAWMVVSAGAAWLARTAARRALKRAGWSELSGKKAIRRIGRDTSLGRVLALTAATAAAMAVAELLAHHGAEAGWRRVTGRRPPK